jgi:hypothetical protein
MTTPTDGILNSLSVEVRYDNALVYLNRCGILAAKIADQLGAPFRLVGLPTTDHTEFRNDPENLTVRFGRKSIAVIQQGARTAAPLEQIAPQVWQTVKEDLGLDRVTRCGYRAVIMWATSTQDEARDLVQRTGLVEPSERWRSLFPQPTWATFIGVSRDHAASETRIAVDAIEHTFDGPLLAGLEEAYPKAAVSLDVDYTYPPTDGKVPYRLSHGQMTEFMRARWEATKGLRRQFSDVLNSVRSPS